MQGLHGYENQVQFYSHSLQRLTQPSSPNFTKEQLLSVLLQQNQKIQIFLERQNLLSNSFPHLSYQTTDSKQNNEQIDSFPSLSFSENKQELLKGINLSLKYHQNQIMNFYRETQKNSDLFKQNRSQNERKRLKRVKKSKNRLQRRFLQSSSNNQKKEMVKWFIEQLCNFVMSKTRLAQKMLAEFKLDHSEIKDFLELFRKEISDMDSLRRFWKEEKNGLGKFIRIVSTTYLRKGYLKQGIRYDDKMGNIGLKFRKLLIQELRNETEKQARR